jgi:uncharacterized transporter YbjL
MLDVLADNPVLTLFLVVGLGSARRRVSEVDAVSLGLGLTLGFLLGLLSLPLGSVSLSLGVAAGPPTSGATRATPACSPSIRSSRCRSSR